MGIPTFPRFWLLLCCTGLFGGRAVCAVGPPVVTVDPEVVRLPVTDANDIRFSHLPRSPGLSQRRVTSIQQDRQGFMWFGTQYGLDRYDGYRFKVFKPEPNDPHSVSSSTVYAQLVDHLGTLWVASGVTLDKFDAHTETFTHYPVDPITSPDIAHDPQHQRRPTRRIVAVHGPRTISLRSSYR
jgi:hypothetical protein